MLKKSVMEKFKIVFMITDNKKWDILFSHIDNLLLKTNIVDTIEVVITDTAILSTLKQCSSSNISLSILRLYQKNVMFWLCGNTLKKYNFSPDAIMPHIKITYDGGIIKILELRANGYYLFEN